MMSAVSPPSPARSLRIGARLGLAFGVLIALMLCIVAVALLRMTNLASATHHIIDVEWPKADAANTLSQIAAVNARRTVQQLISNEQERQQLRQEVVQGRERFIAAFKLLHDTVELPAARALLDRAEQARQAYVKSQARFHELLDAGDRKSVV